MTPNQPAEQSPSQPEPPPLPLAEARRVIWQAQPKQPMGELLDQGILTRQDLIWAIQKAYRLDVRRAAQRLLQELDAPTAPVITSDPPRYGPQVITASDYLEEQETYHGWLLAYYIGLVIAFIFLTISTVTWLLLGHALWLTLLTIAANIGAWTWLLVLIRRQVRRVRTYRAGRQGEAHVVEQLRPALDHRWTIYRNLQLPARTSDLDLVLVGPGGVWVVQIKASAAPLRVYDGRWQVKRGGLWVAAKSDPGAQVTRQATALNDYLKRQGINRFVERAIALAESQPFDQFANTPIPVWLPFNLAQQAQALVTKYPPSDDELARINDLLRRRADEQRAVEAAQQKPTRRSPPP